MLVIIGAAGNVGYATASALRKNGAPVTAILRDPAKATRLEAIGCEVSIVDVQQPEPLAAAVAGASAVQIVVPFRPAMNDPVADMRVSIDSLVTALAAARPARILAISDYGAHVSDDIGMPSVFHGLEARLARLDGCKTVLRSAEHMHNLARAIPMASATGVLQTFQDRLDGVQPMIAAGDVGRIAAELMLRDPTEEFEVIHAEGPRRYSANDTAAALSALSGRRVTAQVIPRAAWQMTLDRVMPPSLAGLLMRTNEAKNKGGMVDVEPGTGAIRYGKTELIDGLRPYAAQ